MPSKGDVAATGGRGKRRRWGLWTAGLLLVSAPVVAAVLVLDSEPLVVEVDQLTSERASQARSFVERVRSEFVEGEQPRQLVVDEDELNGIAALVKRAVPRLSGRINVTRSAALGALSIRVPRTPFGSYVNIAAVVAPSSDGVRLPMVTVGSIRLPEAVARPLCRFALNVLLGRDNGTAMLDMVSGVSLEASRVTVSFHRMADYHERVTEIRDRFRFARQEAVRISDPQVVAIYYRQVTDLATLVPAGYQTSLGKYMTPVFELASRRSASGSAIEENRAAIMALAIALGTSRFEMFTGPVEAPGESKSRRIDASITLKGRDDLRLHFLYSAALKLAADSGVSFALGEFKELLDSNEGGSGFSFADLAADRAGIRFAEEATRDEAHARRLQKSMSLDASESSFFPGLDDLPEGLAKREFASAYGDLESPAYKQALNEIDRRLEALPLFRQAS